MHDLLPLSHALHLPLENKPSSNGAEPKARGCLERESQLLLELSVVVTACARSIRFHKVAEGQNLGSNLRSLPPGCLLVLRLQPDREAFLSELSIFLRLNQLLLQCIDLGLKLSRYFFRSVRPRFFRCCHGSLHRGAEVAVVCNSLRYVHGCATAFQLLLVA